MSLGQFVAKSTDFLKGDDFKARDAADAGTPMIVFVRQFKEGLTTTFSPDGDGQLVEVDLVDLAKNEIKVGVTWWGAAVSDQLSTYAGNGQPLPIKLVWANPRGTGNAYIVPEQLEGKWYEFAGKWWAKYPTAIQEARTKREAEFRTVQAEASGTDAPASLGFGASAPVEPAPVVAPPVEKPVAKKGAVNDVDVDALLASLDD